MDQKYRACLALMLTTLTACSPDHDAALPGDAADNQPFAAIAEGETIHVLGTEPFWGGEIVDGQLTWTTPESSEGVHTPVARFAGRGGLGFSGELDGKTIDLMVTPAPPSAPCSDGMSDRSYPFEVTVTLGDSQLAGCGWTDQQGYSGGE